MTTYTNVFAGTLEQTAWSQYLALTLSANTELSWPTQFQNTNQVVSSLMTISPTGGGFSLTLPDATQASTGQQFTINNPTAFSFSLRNNAAGLITTVAGPSVIDVAMTDNTTVAGTWFITPHGGGYSAVTSVAATSLSTNLLITGSPITTSGTFQFNFANDLLALSSFAAATGIPARTAANTWALRSITGTASQILVTNGNGVAGSPTLALSPNITGISTAHIGNLFIGGFADANSISSFNANGDINLRPSGTGIIRLDSDSYVTTGNSMRFYNPTDNHYISFALGTSSVDQNLLWPTTLSGIGQVLLNDGTGQLEWATVTTFGGPSTVDAIAKYLNITGSLTDSGVLIDGANNITGANSLVASEIGIATIGLATITTTAINADLVVNANGTGEFTSVGNINISPKGGVEKHLKLFNAAATRYVTLRATAGLLASTDYTWPPVNDKGFMYNDGAGALNFFKNLIADAPGGTNLNLGGTLFSASATNAIMIKAGTLATAGVATSIALQAQNVSAGNTSISWYGDGNGGVSAVSPTAQNRTVAITVNGVILYLSAKTTND